MKLRLTVVSMILLLVGGCNTSINNSGTTTFTSEVYPNSDIKDEEIISGDKYVFKYRLNRDPIPQAIDDEYSDVLIFAVDKNNVENFNFQSASDFTSSKATLTRFCFCPPVSIPQKLIISGQIKGTGSISSSSWNIQGIDLKNSNNETLNFPLTKFTLKKP